LSVVREGTGSGTVTSNPAGINCGATCSASFDSGTPVTLTATPATGSTFEGWSGGGCSGTNTCTVTLTANTTVFARFGAPRPTLSVILGGTGSDTVTSNPPGIDCGAACSASFDSGTFVTLTATPASGSTFAGWNGGGCTGTGSCSVTLNAATTVTATFTLQRVTLAVTRAGTGRGTVTSNPAGINCGATCSASFDSGTFVTLTATPASGSIFTGWSGGGCFGTGTCSVTLTASTTVTARFDDVTAPVLSLPGNIVATATSLLGGVVTFGVSATDNVDPSPVVTCSPRSGSLFSVGITRVTCTARDAAGNTSSGSFLITVLGLGGLGGGLGGLL